jgi:hypothetical protein
MSVGEPRKRRRACNLAAERRRKRKERTRGYPGSRRKSAAACRRVSRCAKVAWRRRNIIRKIRTLEKCGWRKEFAAAEIRTTHRAKVAWHKERSHEGRSVEQGRRNNKARNKFTSGTRKGWTFGKRRRVDPEDSTGMKDPSARRQLRLKNEKTAGRIFEKTFRLQIAKREDGSSVELLNIRNSTLWRGRPLKTKKKNARIEGADNVEAPAPTTTERSNWQDFIGCRSGRAHVRRRRW